MACVVDFQGVVGSAPVLCRCQESDAIHMLLGLQQLLASREVGAGEAGPELPPCARMEKFGGGVLPATGHVGKGGETDRAGSVGSWVGPWSREGWRADESHSYGEKGYAVGDTRREPALAMGGSSWLPRRGPGSRC